MRPLLICDCDEVLLHMVRHFGVWLGETHDIDFAPNGGDFLTSMKRRDGTPAPTRDEMWGLLDQFFPDEMDRQTLVPHAREALSTLAESADIVILTNLADQCRKPRIEQLAKFGIDHRVECNQGGKGTPVARLVAEHGDPVTVFVDDLGVHHDSVARHAPQVHRLHMISEPALAPRVPPAPAAHARIDDWREAEAWIAARFAEGSPPGLDPAAIAMVWHGMTDRIDRKLAELGLALPAPAAPVASYVPAVEAGGLLHISGQLPFQDGALMTGRLGEDRDVAFGQEAAQRCALMLVAQMKAALGGLHRVERIVKLGVFVSSTADFTDQPKVANGASDLMVALFGDIGRHARSAVGVSVLPLGAAVEIDAIVQIASA